MSDVLSQSEIDALLNELNSGEIDIDEIENEKDKVKKYDFKRPSKFAKDHIRTLNIIHDNYGKALSNLLTRYLRAPFNMELITIEVLTYRDFSNSISNPSVLSIIDMKPLNGSIVLEIPPTIAYAIIDRVLGGYTDSNEKIKDFTEIEISIMENIIMDMLEAMKEPWENIIKLNPVLDRIETNPQIAQITSQTDMVILITYKAEIDDMDNFINICIPDLVIDPIVPKLSTKLWFSKDESKHYEEQDTAGIKHKIMDTEVPIKTILGKTKIPFDDIANLQVGDVITLDNNLNEKMKVYIDKDLKYLGNPGVSNKRYSIKISDIVDKENKQ
ncbi:MAG: flagellar motor switch protein FliM [Bacillota bacterium]|nr:flagellar motor switch protein FliM [Bacillota bacterium]